MIRGTPQLLLSGKVSLFHCWRTVLPGKAFLVGRFFLSLKTLTISSPFHSLQGFSCKPHWQLYGHSLYEMKLFVLVPIFPLTWSKPLPDFWQFFNVSLSEILFWLNLHGDLWVSCTQKWSFQCGEYFTMYTYVKLAGYTLQIYTIFSIMP